MDGMDRFASLPEKVISGFPGAVLWRSRSMDKRKDEDRRIVYSTGIGGVCPECGKPVSACVCGIPKIPAGDGVVRVRREKKGRGGKTVTSVSGIPLDEQGILDLASRLKRGLGTGGSVKDGVIEIQGDRCEAVIAALAKEGYRVKRSGG